MVDASGIVLKVDLVINFYRITTRTLFSTFGEFSIESNSDWFFNVSHYKQWIWRRFIMSQCIFADREKKIRTKTATKHQIQYCTHCVHLIGYQRRFHFPSWFPWVLSFVVPNDIRNDVKCRKPAFTRRRYFSSFTNLLLRINSVVISRLDRLFRRSIVLMFVTIFESFKLVKEIIQLFICLFNKSNGSQNRCMLNYRITAIFPHTLVRSFNVGT